MASYHPLTAPDDDVIDFVIHVRARVPDDELDEADLDDAGSCVVAGDYRIAVRPGRRGVLFARNQALEIFHALDIISDPDDYHLMVSTYAPAIDRHVRDDLGAWAEAAAARRAPRVRAPLPERRAPDAVCRNA